MPGPEVLERIPGELPVAGKGADGVIDIVGVRRIGHTAVLERLGQLDHLGDVLGGAREHVGRQDVDERLVGVERRLIGIGDLGGRLVLESGLDQHPVLAAVELVLPQVPDVGDVLDVEDLEAVVQQDAGSGRRAGSSGGCRRARIGTRSGRMCTYGPGPVRAARPARPTV